MKAAGLIGRVLLVLGGCATLTGFLSRSGAIGTSPITSNLRAQPPAGYQGRSMLDGGRRMALFFADYSLGMLGLATAR